MSAKSHAEAVKRFWAALDRGDVSEALIAAPFAWSSELHGSQYHVAIEPRRGVVHRGADTTLLGAVQVAAGNWLRDAPRPPLPTGGETR